MSRLIRLLFQQKFNQELPTYTLLTPDKQQNLRNLLKDYFCTLCKHLYSEHKSYQSAIRTNRNILASKGEVSNERKEKLDLMQSNFEKLFASVQAMAELLNENVPELPKDEEDSKRGIVLEIGNCSELSSQQLSFKNHLSFQMIPTNRSWIHGAMKKLKASMLISLIYEYFYRTMRQSNHHFQPNPL